MLPKSKFRVLTSGRILNQKNPALFNEIAKYFEDLDQFEFVWVGDGPDIAALTASNIRITGWLAPDEVIRFVRSADVYLSTSKFEGLSFSVLEALSLKKPVLLSDCVGNRDMVRSGANGNLFEHAHQAIVSIMQYYNNHDMLEIMGKNSADYCEDSFHIETTQQQYKKLYSSGKKKAVA
jgi:glycosyltransferase involved in cell wall biosynthesis